MPAKFPVTPTGTKSGPTPGQASVGIANQNRKNAGTTRPAPPVYRPVASNPLRQPLAAQRLTRNPSGPAVPPPVYRPNPAAPISRFPTSGNLPSRPSLSQAPAGTPFLRPAFRVAQGKAPSSLPAGIRTYRAPFPGVLPRVVQRSATSAAEAGWNKQKSKLARSATATIQYGHNFALPRDTKDQLESLCAEIGFSPPQGDYGYEKKVLSDAELKHATAISEAVGEIEKIILGIFSSGDDQSWNALSSSGFLSRFVRISPETCNQTTSKELLECLATIRTR